MIRRKLIIQNKLGLHARASAQLTQVASEFSSEIWLIKNQHRVNAKSIMGVMMLAAAQDAEIEIEVDGIDEQDALDKLSDLVDKKFGEIE